VVEVKPATGTVNLLAHKVIFPLPGVRRQGALFQLEFTLLLDKTDDAIVVATAAVDDAELAAIAVVVREEIVTD
jgi:hypothetical protein